MSESSWQNTTKRSELILNYGNSLSPLQRKKRAKFDLKGTGHKHHIRWSCVFFKAGRKMFYTVKSRFMIEKTTVFNYNCTLWKRPPVSILISLNYNFLNTSRESREETEQNRTQLVSRPLKKVNIRKMGGSSFLSSNLQDVSTFNFILSVFFRCDVYAVHHWNVSRRSAHCYLTIFVSYFDWKCKVSS